MNVPYHNVLTEDSKIPTKKEALKQWLTSKDIPFTNDMLLPELKAIGKHYQPPKKYKVNIKNSYNIS